MSIEHWWIHIERGNPSTQRETCVSAALSTTNPTWTGPGMDPGFRA